MKKTYRIIIAVLAASMALISCSKERQDVKSASEGPRTIQVSFSAPTKTSLGDDGVTPRFSPGDEIIVSNGSHYQTLPVSVDGNYASITTDLTGTLTAVYPAKAAKLDGTEIIGVLVPSNQTGRFRDANIAMAKIPDGASKAYFENQTAILKFYVDESIGVTGIRIISKGERIADGFIDEKGAVIEQGTEDEIEVNYTTRITVQQIADPEANYYQPNYIPLWQLTDDPQMRVCYVAIRPTAGSDTYSLKVSSRTTTQTANNGLLQKNQLVGGMVQRVFENVSLPANTLANVFIPYYIPVNVGTEGEPEYQYWAYCNVGAFLPEEPGYYYSWGNTEGHWLNGVSDNYQFTADVYNETSGGQITANRLTPESDAAYTAWGGKWRMPTNSESQILKALVVREYSNKYGKYGYSLGALFLPSAGHIADYAGSMTQWNQESSSEFWTSDKYSSTIDAYYFYKCPDNDYSATGRYYGIPIRPIHADPLPEGNGLEVNKYNEGPTL